MLSKACLLKNTITNVTVFYTAKDFLRAGEIPVFFGRMSDTEEQYSLLPLQENNLGTKFRKMLL